jgi:ribose/xylose/arabinose/galactoside ABC-type transport system permease subunit
MTLLGVPSDNQFLVRGAIILAAVLMNQLQQRNPR